MEEAKKEEESSAKTTNEKDNKTKKNALLQLKKHKKKKKKHHGHRKETLLQNFESEAVKFNQKMNEHAQRKGQDLVKVIAVNSSQSSLAKETMQDKIHIKLDDEENEEEEFDTNKMWAALENELRTPRTAVACTNLAKNSGLRLFRKRRPRKFKNIRAARAFRAAYRRRLHDGESSPMPSSADESANENEQNEIFRIKSQSSPTAQPLSHVFSTDSYWNTAVLEEQQPDAKDKWVHSVLTIPMFNQENQLYYKADDHITIPSPTFQAKTSEERLNVSHVEEAIIEFGQVDCDKESKPFVGQPKVLPEEHIIQNPPNMVPRYHKYKSPIRHHHCINDDPFTYQERGLEQIVSQGIVGLSRLIRRHNRTLNPHEQLGTLLWPSITKQNQRNIPDENRAAVLPGPDPLTAFNALIDGMDKL